jgi:cell division protein FtsI/penicillin-binding protein 2
VTPWWIDRVLDAEGRELPLPPRAPRRRVMSEALTSELRAMLVRTTTHGTARSAFRDRRGRPKLGSIKVAGKTGNLSGSDPKGRYEWFIGAAPAGEPSIAVAVLQLQSNLWWAKSSQLAADVLHEIFCESRRCDPTLASRFTGDLDGATTPILLSESAGG